MFPSDIQGQLGFTVLQFDMNDMLLSHLGLGKAQR